MMKHVCFFGLGLCSRAAELATTTAIGCEALRRKKKGKENVWLAQVIDHQNGHWRHWHRRF